MFQDLAPATGGVSLHNRFNPFAAQTSLAESLNADTLQKLQEFFAEVLDPFGADEELAGDEAQYYPISSL